MDIVTKKYLEKCSTPSDINEHLPTIQRYCQQCNTVTEFGMRSVVSTWALLNGLLSGSPGIKKMVSVDLNYSSDIEQVKKLCDLLKVDFYFIMGNDIKINIEQTDLLFIDTWHIYGHLKRELNLHHNKVNKYILLHDTEIDKERGETIRNGWNPAQQSLETGYPIEEIIKGLGPAVKEFLQDHPEWTIEEHYTNNNGLTVLKKQSELIPSKQEIVIGLMACCSKEKYISQIEGCKNTWCKNENKNIYFFSGQDCPFKKCDSNIIHLSRVEDDVLSATYKQWFGLMWLYDNHPNADFYYIAGTDTYVRMDKIKQYLQNLDPTKNLYIGGDGVICSFKGKEFYYHSGGSGFILSNNLVKLIYPHILNWMQIWDKNEFWIKTACDWSIAALFDYLNLDIISISLPNLKACDWKGLTKEKIKCCEKMNIEDIWVCHYMEPQDMIDFEEELKK